MKKILCIVLIAILSLTGCGGKQPVKTEEELRQEIKAEMEAKAKLEAEVRAEMEDEAKKNENINEQENNTVNQTNNNQSVDNSVVDIRDKEAIADFILSNYNVSTSVKKEDIKNLTFIYSDFNNDNVDDVVCYSEDTFPFREVAFITAANGQLERIKGGLDFSPQYTHSISKEGDFIIYRLTGGGTGIQTAILRIYKYYNGEITFTGTSLLMEQHEGHPPTPKFPNGYQSETICKVIDKSGSITGSSNSKWVAFEYSATKTEGENKKVVEDSVDYYEYNGVTNGYEVSNIQNTSADNSGSISSNTESTNGPYDISKLESGDVLEGAEIIEVYYQQNDRAIIELEKEYTFNGRIIKDEMYDGYALVTQDRMLKNPIMVEGLEVYGPSYVSMDDSDLYGLTDTEKKYLKEQGTLDVQVTMTSFLKMLKVGSETSERIQTKSIKVTTEIDSNYGESEYYEGTSNKKLTGFENETFVTSNQGDYFVDYSKYRCVIVPMHQSKNMHSKLEYKGVTFEGDNPTRVEFCIFGELEDVKLEYIANMGAEGKYMNLGTVKNNYVDVIVPMPTDMSVVIVTGKYNEGEGTYRDIRFTLDDCRDVDAYDVIVIE